MLKATTSRTISNGKKRRERAVVGGLEMIGKKATGRTVRYAVNAVMHMPNTATAIATSPAEITSCGGGGGGGGGCDDVGVDVRVAFVHPGRLLARARGMNVLTTDTCVDVS